MDFEERMEKALEVLGDDVKIVNRKKGGKKKPFKKVSSFTPKSKKRRRDMSKSEYSQCGKKIRYKTHADAVMAKQVCERARGKRLRVYKCDICGGYHLSSSFKFNGDGS